MKPIQIPDSLIRLIGVPLGVAEFPTSQCLSMLSSLLYAADVETHRVYKDELDLLVGLVSAKEQNYAIVTSEGEEFIREVLANLNQNIYEALSGYGLLLEPSPLGWVVKKSYSEES